MTALKTVSIFSRIMLVVVSSIWCLITVLPVHLIPLDAFLYTLVS